MTVVRMAITSSRVKACWPITPASRPTLMTISSISARAFISEPTAMLSRQPSPAIRAPAAPPAILPTTAAPMISPSAPSPAPTNASPVVFSPARAKKIGIRTMIARCSMRSIRVRSSRSSRGRQAPNRNAPNTACRRSHSVTAAHANRPMNSAASTIPPGTPSFACLASSHAYSGRSRPNTTAHNTARPMMILKNPP